MYITRFIQTLDFRILLKAMMVMLRMFGLISVIPFLVSLIAGEFEFTLIFALLTAVPFGLGQLLGSKEVYDLAVKEALVVTALTYLMFPVLSALAFMPAASFVDGFFESMSGFTTHVRFLNPLYFLDIHHRPGPPFCRIRHGGFPF